MMRGGEGLLDSSGNETTSRQAISSPLHGVRKAFTGGELGALQRFRDAASREPCLKEVCGELARRLGGDVDDGRDYGY